jgi:transposase-like protein
MKFGPRKTEELARLAIAIRAETGDSWSAIAKRLGVSLDWVRRNTVKVGREPARIVRTVATSENIARAKELRAANTPWKVIARELGVDSWSWLRRQVLYP